MSGMFGERGANLDAAQRAGGANYLATQNDAMRIVLLKARKFIANGGEAQSRYRLLEEISIALGEK